MDFETKELVEKAIREIDLHLSVTEIRIVVGSGELSSIRDREELEAGTAMKSGKVRTIHVNEAVGDCNNAIFAS